MAIPFGRFDPVGLSNGKSAVAVSAYFTRSKVHREATGETFDFSRLKDSEELFHSEVLIPENAPREFLDAAHLWNSAELADTKKSDGQFKARSQFALQGYFALPKELPFGQQLELARRLVHEHFVSKGIPVQIAIHMKDGNPHVHILRSTRRLRERGFAEKARDLNPSFAHSRGRHSVSQSQGWPDVWADFQNAYFEELGFDLRVDAKSLVPGKHLGPAAARVPGSEKSEVNNQRDVVAAEIVLAPEESMKLLEAATARKATFSPRELQSLIKRQLKDRPEIDYVEVANRLLAAPDVIPLFDAKGRQTGRFTTRQVREQEQRILGLAMGMVRQHDRAADESAIQAVARASTMDEEQRAAYVLATGRERMATLRGLAGTGKSFTMSKIREAYEKSGFRVEGLAPTNAVVADMAKDDFSSPRTVAAHTWATENPDKAARKGWRPWDARTVVIIDEAAMLAADAVEALVVDAHATGAKLIWVGDDAQLASIQRGGMFRPLADLGQAEIRKVRRQSEDWMKQASEDLAAGRVRLGIRAYVNRGRVKFSETHADAKDALVSRWAADTAERPTAVRFVYAAKNVEVIDLNQKLRAIRRERGEVGEGIEYDVEKGDLAYKQTLGIGDRIQFNSTRKDIDPQCISGNFGTIQAADANSITVKTDSGILVTFDPKEYNSFALGYAGTVYKGQGKTQVETYGLYSNMWNKRNTYVGATRHKADFHLFVGRDECPHEAALIKRMQQDDELSASINFFDAAQLLARGVTPEGQEPTAAPVGILGTTEPHAPAQKPPKRVLGEEGCRADATPKVGQNVDSTPVQGAAKQPLDNLGQALRAYAKALAPIDVFEQLRRREKELRARLRQLEKRSAEHDLADSSTQLAKLEKERAALDKGLLSSLRNQGKKAELDGAILHAKSDISKLETLAKRERDDFADVKNELAAISKEIAKAEIATRRAKQHIEKNGLVEKAKTAIANALENHKLGDVKSIVKQHGAGVAKFKFEALLREEEMRISKNHLGIGPGFGR